MKCQPKANNNREAVVICGRHVVKRTSKRSVPVIYYTVTSFFTMILVGLENSTI